MKNITKFILTGSVALFMASCAADSEKPVIDIHEPTENAIIEVGTEFHLDFTITDNDALNQFKVDIHGDHDGHTHGKLAEVFPAFDTIIIENISGNVVDRHIDITIPTLVWPGPYHISVYATDISGNEGLATRTIIIRNSIDLLVPVVNITTPSNGATLSNTFTVNATISDKLSDGTTDGEIRQIEVLIIKGSQKFSLGKYDEISNFSGAFNQATGQFSRSFNLPSGITSGTWELKVEAYDSYFNKSHGSIDVIVP
ncbi:MAG: DUF4625 domain-containing protein [Flavobacteriales bacterium]|nr:DUF4625 domain-containing protein [Flavobacteriales bacterium]